MKLFHITLSLLALTPVTAFAQDATPSVPVAYSDLNLRSEAGMKALDHPLARAVRSICAGSEGIAALERRIAAERCIRQKSAEVTVLRNRAIARYASPDALASR
jgi:UrcA family protein